MSKEKNDQNNQDERILSLGVNMLKSILDMEPDLIRKANDFLRQAFIDLSDHSEFDEEFYRKKWKNQLYDLNEAAIPFEGYSEEEIQLSLEVAIKVLEKHKAKVLEEKEGKHD